MKHLLDTNLLLALAHTLHAQHSRAEQWLKSISGTADIIGTCAITELGFVRVSVETGLQPDIGTALQALAKLKKSSPVKIEFWPDSLGADQLSKKVKKPTDLTDGHLLELARANNAQFATLDGKIPGAVLVP